MMGSHAPTLEREAVGTSTEGRRRSTKIRAILAGGLVLGLGAAITLAAWTDNEFASGTFTAGNFVFQGASVQNVYGDHTTSGGAANLAFTVPATAMTPGDSVTAPFSVKLTGSSSATIQLANATTDTAQGFTYSIKQTSVWGCGTGTVKLSGALGTADSVALTTMAPGDEQFFCFTVTASTDQTGVTGLIKGTTSTGVWNFAATSTP